MFLQTTNDKLSQCIHYLDAYSSENNLKMPTFTAKSAKVYVRNKIKLFICLKKYSIAYLDTYKQYLLYNQFNNSYLKIILICNLFHIFISIKKKKICWRFSSLHIFEKYKVLFIVLNLVIVCIIFIVFHSHLMQVLFFISN